MTTPVPQILMSPTTAGGFMKALFQSLESGDGHAEVVRVLAADAATQRPGNSPASGGPGFGGPGPAGDVPAVAVTMGWAWIIGLRPVVKTRRVIGSADGTTFFVRSTATLDQFYFVGPASSRVYLRTIPSMPGRPPVVIDMAHPYAECSGGSITVRAVMQGSAQDAEFLSAMSTARVAAQSAGLVE